MTVEDPEVLTTGKWSAAFPLKLDNDYVMYEYACHEGNTAIRNYIETSRFERAKKKAGLVSRDFSTDSEAYFLS